MTPAELAVEIWGPDEEWAFGRGARKVRQAARALLPDYAPGYSDSSWDLSDQQAGQIRQMIAGQPSVDDTWSTAEAIERLAAL
jgi:hypothetical protein